MPRSGTFRGLFPRIPESVAKARRIVVDIARRWLHGRDLDDFHIALGEALANAAEHGGGHSFVVTCGREGNFFFAEVLDHGLGIDPSRALGVEPGEGAPRGYGFFIMHAVLDGIELLDNGKRLRIAKLLSACANGSKAAEDAV